MKKEAIDGSILSNDHKPQEANWGSVTTHVRLFIHCMEDHATPQAGGLRTISDRSLARTGPRVGHQFGACYVLVAIIQISSSSIRASARVSTSLPARAVHAPCTSPVIALGTTVARGPLRTYILVFYEGRHTFHASFRSIGPVLEPMYPDPTVTMTRILPSEPDVCLRDRLAIQIKVPDMDEGRSCSLDFVRRQMSVCLVALMLACGRIFWL